MPTYEYECKGCCHRFELRQSFSDSPVNSCPQCKSEVWRVLSPVPVIFKGSGFYITDSRAKNPVQEEPANNEPKPKPSAAKAEKPEKKD